MTRNLWITGVAGFTGGHLVNEIRTQDDPPRIVGLDLREEPAPGVDAYHRVDLCSPDDVAVIARRDEPTWVIHLAGATPPAPEDRLWHANVGSTVGLLRGLLLADSHAARVLTVGSAAEYVAACFEGLPETSACGGTSAYGRAKWAQTLLNLTIGHETGLSTMVVRPFNLLGPGLSTGLVAGRLCEQFAAADSAGEIVMGNIHSARDFIDVRDAVRAYWQVVRLGRVGEVYNICSGIPVKIEHLVDLLREITGKSPRIRVEAARLRSTDPPVHFGDNGKVNRLCGWTPQIALKTSLTDMLHYHLHRDDG